MTAALFSRLWVPAGNTGGANVSAMRPMPVPPDLQALLDSVRRRSARQGCFDVSAETPARLLRIAFSLRERAKFLHLPRANAVDAPLFTASIDRRDPLPIVEHKLAPGPVQRIPVLAGISYRARSNLSADCVVRGT